MPCSAKPLVATLSHDHTVRLWSLATGAEVAVLTGHQQRPVAGAFSADGRALAIGGELGMIHVWDVATAQEILTLTDFHVELLTDIGFRDPKTLMAIGREHDQLRVGIWEAAPSR